VVGLELDPVERSAPTATQIGYAPPSVLENKLGVMARYAFGFKRQRQITIVTASKDDAPFFGGGQ
jgi:hypothetical protein